MHSTKVLLVEDNDQNAYLVRFLLEKEAMEVKRAHTGPEGLAAAAAEKPDIVLLDIQLPGLDGYEVAAKLRQNPALSGVPIVALTSFAMPAEREKALSVGCTGYIEKPISALKLVAQVRSYLAAK